MKRNLGKKVVALLTTTAMLATLLTGCSSDTEESTTTEDSSTEATEATAEATDSSDPFAFESVSDVVFPLEETLTLTVFVKATNTGGGTYQDNYVTDWIEEETNIHLDFQYDLDGDEATTKLNLVMADPSSMPDIFIATGWTKSEALSYGQQGLILPLNEYLDDATNWNLLNEIADTRKEDLTMTDGNIYTYGAEDACFHCTYQNRMWIYEPWVELLNDGHMPETTEELYDYLVKVKTEDPNGNGIADEIPMSGYLDGWSTDPTVWLINSFVQCNNPLSNTNPTVAAGLYVNESGTIEYAVMDDAYQGAVEYINTLYAEGLLDSQTFTQDNTQFKATLDNEEHLVAVAPGGLNNADSSAFFAGEEGDWQDWTYFDPVAGPDGVQYAATAVTSYWGSSIGSVSSNCEYPVIAVALFDFLSSEEATLVQGNGPEGFGWEWTTEGTALDGGTPAYRKYTLDETFDWIGNGFEKEYANWYWAADGQFGATTLEFRSSIYVDDPEFELEYILQEAAESYVEYAYDTDSLVPNLVFDGTEAQAMSEYTLSIGGYVNQAMVQFITGDLDPVADWDSYISTLEDMGVSDYLSLYQATYDTYMAAQ